MMNVSKEFVNKFIGLDFPEQLTPTVFHDWTEAVFCDPYEEREADFSEGLWFAMGCSRGVIGSNDEDYVLKFAFDATDRFYMKPYPLAFNYCEKEVKIYQQAVEEVLDQFFLPIEEVGRTKNNRPIYAEPRVFTLEEVLNADVDTFAATIVNYRPSDEAFTAAKELNVVIAIDDEDNYEDLLWFWACMIDRFSLEEIQRLDEFLEERDLVADLHTANIGYTLDARPVLIDYGGFSG